jgi:hypothetical protein
MASLVRSVGVATALVAVLAAAADGSGSGGCRVERSRLLLSNLEARVLEVPYLRDRSQHYVAGCALVRNELVALDDPLGDTTSFGKPALTLRHTLMAGARNACDSLEPPCETSVIVFDLRRARTHFGISAVPPRWRGTLVKVGSVRLTANGGIAWIACPEPRQSSSVVPARRAPTCTRPGHHDAVLAVSGGDVGPGKPRPVVHVLSEGFAIAPRSLRVRGNVLSWREGKHRTHAYWPSGLPADESGHSVGSATT